MITSIYLKEHEYLINKPQTLNFGGKYLYFFQQMHDNNLVVQRKLNDKYIPDFFNISESNSSVNLLSAVVGQNGVGKSTVLDIIRSSFVENDYSLPYNNSVILIEVDGQTKVLQSGNSILHLQIETSEGIDYVSIPKVDQEQYQSIYYSPHFDLKYNDNFSEIDKYDISLDQFIKDDLAETDKKGTNENGWRFGLHTELVFKNSMRQIEFLNSNIFKDNIVFREVFNLPQYETGILHFRDIEFSDFHNTPFDLRPIIELILKKTENENKNWHLIRTFDKNNNVENQADVNKYLLERFVIKAFISVVIQQMEKENTWLQEGNIEDSHNMDKFKDLSSIELLFYFIKESYIEKGNFKKEIFNYEGIILFFEKLNFLFEKEKDPSNIKKQSIRLNLNEVKEIMELHKKIIINLLDYYPKFENLVDKNNYVEGFLSFRPTDRNMSSGENALLNFFSKLYSFIQDNLIKESKSLHDKENYILLLDEADLGFHPVWKKKYIEAILKTLPYFFETLQIKPNLQIIITTHDPFTLSDLPIDNVVFLYKDKGYCSVILENDRIQKTFGANITNLLAHSFFVDDGLIGDFSKSKIREVIDWINENKNLSETRKSTPEFLERLEYYKKVINLIDEKITKLKLSEMITDLVPDSEYYNQIIEDEITLLRKKKR
ncbi:hypothetical protein OF897_12245 [Chryseobacterium formosus]|uniref:ATPase AAA-type core domain-containing protein n=1 Tax=Chryseobacterium formosus TaxID=1537363 RepID=A0ABT3XRE2_9FLAO|nr:hypothetical protein [Chryseobacterium formosus]MCX8524684.1 hypothetical protein [Chryseobacterium formosus]